ncbi:MAG: class I SAM-dependent methyltransferase, partial [Candidatus Micrarchaeaceae archaeon]
RGGAEIELISPRTFQPALSLPVGYRAEQLRGSLERVRVDGSREGELAAYAHADFERFLYTLNLVSESSAGRALEIGSSPYFTTLLFRKFRPSLSFDLVNYFGGPVSTMKQHISFPGFDGAAEEFDVEFANANIESDTLPFENETFDAILFCEVLEHMTMDPLHAMLEIKRVLKQGGKLILTTPNSARLENAVSFIEGRNIYDPYSRYGPHGRHNREYTRHELALLLEHCGFDVEQLFTANVHDDIMPDPARNPFINSVIRSIPNREFDLGQYLFSASVSRRPANPRRPAWLFRSYDPEEMA